MESLHEIQAVVCVTNPRCGDLCRRAQDDATDDDVEAQTNTVAYLNLTYDKSGAAQVDLTLPAQPRSFLCILCG